MTTKTVHHMFSYSALIAVFFSICSYGMEETVITSHEKIDYEEFEPQLKTALRAIDKLDQLQQELYNEPPTLSIYREHYETIANTNKGKIGQDPNIEKDIFVGVMVDLIGENLQKNGDLSLIAELPDLYQKIQRFRKSEKNTQQVIFSPEIETPISPESNLETNEVPRRLEDPKPMEIFLTKEELQEKEQLQNDKSSPQQKSWLKEHLVFTTAAGLSVVITILALLYYLQPDIVVQWFASHMPKYSLSYSR